MDRVLTSLKNLWTGMTAGQRIVLFSMVAAFAVSAAVLSTWVRTPDMAVLTAGADMARAGEIVRELESKGVKYKVTQGGRTILVEREMVSELAVGLAADGLIGDDSGGKILDSKNVGMLPSQILRDNLRRVLQADLGRMIAGLRAVETAQVQLALPEESVFVEDEKKPTASVLVRLRAGAALTSEQIQGIANLVSAGVEGLEPSNVSIVDSEGSVLWGGDADGENAAMARLDKKKEIERHLGDKATRMLAKVLGAGNTVVSVDVSLSWDQSETRTKKFDPERTAVRSEQRDEATSGTDGTTESSVTNYEVDETELFVQSRGARLINLTTSVAINYREVVGSDKTSTFEKIPPEELEELKSLVMNAVGFDETRGDRISLINQRFTSSPAVSVRAGFFDSPIFQMLPSMLGKLIAFAVTALLLLTFRKQLSSPLGPAARGTAGARKAFGGGLAAGIPEAATGTDGPRVSPEDRFQNLAQGNPENVARVMKSWMDSNPN